MRKFILLIVITACAILVSPQFVSAQEVERKESTTSAVTKSSYTLAYPGLLPNNPLYKLKTLRDKIMVTLITKPEKKVEFYLLQTDKQIAMVPLLIEKGEVELAKETALKGEHNYTEITHVYKNSQTKPDAKMLQKLKDAGLKHQEVLLETAKKVKGNDAKTFTQVAEFSKVNITELEEISAGENN